MLLTSAAYVHLKHYLSKHIRNLSPASRAIWLSGPAELHHQMVAKALAHFFELKLLLLDVNRVFAALLFNKLWLITVTCMPFFAFYRCRVNMGVLKMIQQAFSAVHVSLLHCNVILWNGRLWYLEMIWDFSKIGRRTCIRYAVFGDG
ncbi:hypothetical protein RchiOBHm_Chr1g0379091 [Rosa chinensis]|uniref:Uncharacterized protein n=1 Tax=Rosa chinensis TaxID=74649 RepID=A0A2P6SNH2_ROSCH|nr:hypothetical protein RchiOBHm_Chr1g0379091 [Rosa chinensis]